jgi:pimeloyl-ACP methyl ester carboxylesterase
MTIDGASAPPIVLIHGLWMTPRSWEHWITRFERRGHRVLAPTYPGLEVEVEALRADPSPIAPLTVSSVAAHLEGIIRGLEQPPILIGHSFGGTLVQLLLDRGCGAAGVAINSAPTEGVLVTPPSQIKALFPVLQNPANWHKAVGFTPEQFHYAFTNTLSAEESAKVYERYAIAAPARIVWTGVLGNIIPGHQEAWVDYANGDRAPLLFIAGGADHIMPASVNRSNAKHYARSSARTEYKEYPGRSHYTCGEDGWEAVADYALEWALTPAASAPPPGRASA